MIRRSFSLRHLIPSLKISPHHQFKLQSQNYASPAASSAYSHALSDEENTDIDWDAMGFNLTPTDYMYVMKCNKDDDFTEGQLSRYGGIELSPAAGVLNYGQGLFEGLKAIRREDGQLVLFRPDQNALRMKLGAERMCMPSPSIDQFIDAVKQTALANKRWIPPPGKGSLYIRPLLIGTGPILGLAPAPEYTFLTYASPVGNYFKEGPAPLNLYVETEQPKVSQTITETMQSAGYGYHQAFDNTPQAPSHYYYQQPPPSNYGYPPYYSSWGYGGAAYNYNPFPGRVVYNSGGKTNTGTGLQKNGEVKVGNRKKKGRNSVNVGGNHHGIGMGVNIGGNHGGRGRQTQISGDVVIGNIG